jgi:4-carboxymuconolactone decarboxylase
MEDGKRYQKGMTVRRAVLGNAHVDQAESNKGDFTAAFQDLIVRYVWGEIWRRPGLTRKTRSLITIGMMVALNRAEELRLHLRAASNSGVTQKEIKEVLLQAAIYCGVPAANNAFHIAEEVFAETRKKG